VLWKTTSRPSEEIAERVQSALAWIPSEVTLVRAVAWACSGMAKHARATVSGTADAVRANKNAAVLIGDPSGEIEATGGCFIPRPHEGGGLGMLQFRLTFWSSSDPTCRLLKSLLLAKNGAGEIGGEFCSRAIDDPEGGVEPHPTPSYAVIPGLETDELTGLHGDVTIHRPDEKIDARVTTGGVAAEAVAVESQMPQMGSMDAGTRGMGVVEIAVKHDCRHQTMATETDHERRGFVITVEPAISG
jgi:hypothetical protein